jgi:Na+/melibiose symporter-like transporter
MILKINKIIWFLTLVAVLLVIVNNSVFVHTHILQDGRIVEHAHPYNSSDKSPGSKQPHHHSNQEFLLLDNIYHLLKNTHLVFIIVLFFFLIVCEHLNLKFRTYYSTSIKKTKLSRAPPHLQFSLSSVS